MPSVRGHLPGHGYFWEGGSSGHDGMMISVLWAFESRDYPSIPALPIHENGNFLFELSIWTYYRNLLCDDRWMHFPPLSVPSH